MIRPINWYFEPTQASIYDTGSLSAFEMVAKLVEKINGCINEFNNLEKKTTNDYNNFLLKIKEYEEEIIKLVNANTQEIKDFENQFRTLMKTLETFNITLDYIEKQAEEVQELAKKNEEAIHSGTVATLTDIDEVREELDLVDKYSKGIKNLKYKMVSTTLSPDTTPSTYEFTHLKKQGMDCALITMVNIESNSSTTFSPMTFTKLQGVVDDANSIGVKVQMLKPHIGINYSDGYNRKNYVPSSYDEFFKNWTQLLLDHAEFCKTNNIPILCMSCEMTQTTLNTHADGWKKVYETIKAKYPDLLLIHAPKNGEIGDKKHIETWQYCDIIGTNIYLSYTYKRFTNEEEGLDITEIGKAFFQDVRTNRTIDYINNIVRLYDKPVLITEIGCMPWDDGLIDVRCEKKVQNFYVPKYLAESACTYLFNHKSIIGFAWWHTNTPFNYFKDGEVLPLEQYFMDTFGGEK